MGQWLGGCCAQPHGIGCPDEGHVKPERDPVHCPRMQHVELDGNLDTVKICLVGCLEVDDVAHGLSCADVYIKSVNNGLSEVFFEGFASEDGKIDTVEVLLIPEVHLENTQFQYKILLLILISFTLLNCSMYKASSVNGARWRSPRDGNIFPPGLRNFLAWRKVSSILSLSSM